MINDGPGLKARAQSLTSDALEDVAFSVIGVALIALAFLLG
jgi:hypothetical protein